MKPTLLIISYSNVIRLKIALSLILRELGNLNIVGVTQCVDKLVRQHRKKRNQINHL
jgi:hypothetical protein